MSKLMAKTFIKDGTRFMIPPLGWSDDPDMNMPYSRAIDVDAMVLCVILNADNGEDIEFEIDENGEISCHHFKCQVRSEMFNDGKLNIMIIGGKKYEEFNNDDN